MAAFDYNPTQYSLPKLPTLTPNSSVLPPKTNIGNNAAREFLDVLGKNLKPVNSYSSQYDMNNARMPYNELGNQFIQQNLLPEFQQNTYNPFMRQMQNRTASSNISLLGNAPRFQQQQTQAITRPFYDQASQVQQQFANLGEQNLQDVLKNYYNSNYTF